MTSQRTRDRLIQRLREEGIADERVLKIMAEVPRHMFVDEALASRAYEDTALPIGHGQTISQPYIVARMTSALLGEEPPANALEIGTGSGYQTVVLARLVDEVYTVERLEPLLQASKRRLARLRCRNVHFRLADGSLGWPEQAPFGAIIVTAAAVAVPEDLREQLTVGGRLVIPVEDGEVQVLRLITRQRAGFTDEQIELVNFVPLVADKG